MLFVHNLLLKIVKKINANIDIKSKYQMCTFGIDPLCSGNHMIVLWFRPLVCAQDQGPSSCVLVSLLLLLLRRRRRLLPCKTELWAVQQHDSRAMKFEQGLTSADSATNTSTLYICARPCWIGHWTLPSQASTLNWGNSTCWSPTIPSANDLAVWWFSSEMINEIAISRRNSRKIHREQAVYLLKKINKSLALITCRINHGWTSDA